MANNTLKLLAQKAKKRLSTAGQTITVHTEKKSIAYLSPTSYAIVASTQDLQEDPLYFKVKKLLSKEDVFNPIAELTDYEIFNKLSDVEKEKYVIDISKKYNEIKNYILKNEIS